MDENKLKHLEFIQTVISRMNSNSFLVKGWSVTLIAAIFALAAKEADHAYAIVVYFPIVAFWGLDGFFISQERRYRHLYKEVRKKTDSTIDFDMSTDKFCNTLDDNGKSSHWWPCVWSKTLIPFHGTLLAVTIIVMFVIPLLKGK